MRKRGREREREGERFREHGMEIARDTKGELYTDLDISGKKK